MADLAEILQQAMSNPQIMSQVATLAQSLGIQNTPPAESSPPQHSEKPTSAQAISPWGMPNVSQQGARQAPQFQQDPRQLMGSLLQMSRSLGGDERQLALLRALKPFVRPERAQKLERAIQIARMSRLAGQALSSLSTAQGQVGDSHV